MRSFFLVTAIKLCMSSLTPTALDLFAHRLRISRTLSRGTITVFNPNIIIDKYNIFIDSGDVEHQDPYHMILYRYLCGIVFDQISGKCLLIESESRERAIGALETLLHKARSKSVILPPSTSVCLSPDSPARVQRYQEELIACQARTDTPAICAVVDRTFLIAGTETSIKRELARGVQGIVYETSNPAIVVKQQIVPDCNEIAAMKVLDGLVGFSPKLHEISSGACPTNHLVAMDKLGDSDWETVMNDPANHVPLADAYLRFSKLLLALKSLHYSGFAHGDFHTQNVRVDRDDPTRLYIIDFGFLSPFVDRVASFDLQSTFRDFIREFFRVRRDQFPNSSTFDWILDGVAVAMRIRDNGVCPNFDLWIWVFETLANPTDQDISQVRQAVVATFPAEYEEWKRDGIQIAQRDGNFVSFMRFPKSFALPIPEPFLIPPIPMSLSHMYPDIEKMFSEQASSDLHYPETRPYLYHNGEIVKEMNEGGFLVSRILPESTCLKFEPNSIVRETLEIPKLRIEYRSNCDNLDIPLLGMQREFGLMKLFESLGLVTPQPVWLSPPVKLPETQSLKIRFFKAPNTLYKQCAQDDRSQVRYMVTKAYSTILDLFGRRSIFKFSPIEKFLSGINMAISLINQLKIMHVEKRIIHGSVNPKSIMKLSENDKYGFSNFGQTFFEAELGECGGAQCATLPIFELGEAASFKTHWELAGSRPSFRDDVFNVLLVFAWIMNPYSEVNFDRETNSAETVKKWKSSDFIFQSTDGGDLALTFPSLDPLVMAEISEHLHNALTLARYVDSVEKMPNHDAIITELESALTLASSPATSE
jgi:serine/threonine protein kinase